MNQADKARNNYFRLYRAAKRADNIYQARLKRAYGRRASDMRYAPPAKRSPEINQACIVYQRTIKRMHDAYAAWKRSESQV